MQFVETASLCEKRPPDCEAFVSPTDPHLRVVEVYFSQIWSIMHSGRQFDRSCAMKKSFGLQFNAMVSRSAGFLLTLEPSMKFM